MATDKNGMTEVQFLRSHRPLARRLTELEVENETLRQQLAALAAIGKQKVGEVWRLVNSVTGYQFEELYDSEWHASAAQLRYNGDSTGKPITVQRLGLYAAPPAHEEHLRNLRSIRSTVLTGEARSAMAEDMDRAIAAFTAQAVDVAQFHELADKWLAIAAKRGVRQFTGNDRKLFANELRALIDGSKVVKP